MDNFTNAPVKNDDIISRQAAIEVIEAGRLTKLIDAETAVNGLKALPPAQQWTPVTKRLPKAYESVNVTVKIPEGRYVQESAFVGTGWEGISAPAEVVAWCPLLAPWEGDQDGERKDGDGNES